jgi:hypothetical protein
MKTQRVIHLRAALAFGLLAIVSAGVRAQSYGVEDQTLTLGAAEFGSGNGFDGEFNGLDGYLYNMGNAYTFTVPLRLPEGALIEKVCLYARDDDHSLLESVGAWIDAVKLVPGGGTPYGVIVAGSGVNSPIDNDYSKTCSSPLAYTLQSTIDLDGDGTVDSVVYYVAAYLPDPIVFPVGLGGVQITWKRQVSPPPATPTFADVPASDGAWPYVEALAASGITAGCGNGNYCPDATLTRRQMAVFLSKALGLHWTN